MNNHIEIDQVDNGGLRLAYSATGAGQTLVHLPGIPFSDIAREAQMPQYRDWFDRLGRGRRLVRYDGRGLGQSTRDLEGRALDIDAMAGDLEAVIRAAGGAPVDLYGRVHAGAVALRFAATRPDLVRRIVVMRGYVKGTDHQRSRQGEDARALLRDQGWDAFTENLGPLGPRWTDPDAKASFTEYVRGAVDDDAFLRYDSAFRQIDVSADLSRVTAPTLLVFRRARPQDEDRAQAMAAALPCGELVMLPGGKRPFLSDAAELAELVHDFLDRGGPTGQAGLKLAT